MAKIDIKSLAEKEIISQIEKLGFSAFRGNQIKNWLDKSVTDFEDMKNLPKNLIKVLKENFIIPHVVIEEVYQSKSDDTIKFLFKLNDEQYIESVLMKYKHGWSQCLSTQVGCKMGCTFCATGLDGFTRNLLPSEMMSQIEVAEKYKKVRVSSVVLMGMGEPLDNLDNVLRFFEMLSEPSGVHIGARHITLSTCGLVDQIYKLMEHKLSITLSVSLHAPNDEIRRKTMPVAKIWSVSELILACRDYTKNTGRRVSFEYAMIDGINDSDDNAKELASRLKGMLCHVNLIPLNPLNSDDKKRLESSNENRLNSFSVILKNAGIPVTIRRTLGADINASCGQLRQKHI